MLRLLVGHRRCFHHPLETQGPALLLSDVVGHGQRHDIGCHDTLDRENIFAHRMQRLQGGGVIDTGRVRLVDKADDDRIMQSKSFFDEIVKNAVRLIGRQHVFRIGIDRDTRYLPAEQDRQQGHPYIDGSGPSGRQSNDLVFHPGGSILYFP